MFRAARQTKTPLPSSRRVFGDIQSARAAAAGARRILTNAPGAVAASGLTQRCAAGESGGESSERESGVANFQRRLNVRAYIYQFDTTQLGSTTGSLSLYETLVIPGGTTVASQSSRSIGADEPSLPQPVRTRPAGGDL